jgi:hypothetical protein
MRAILYTLFLALIVLLPSADGLAQQGNIPNFGLPSSGIDSPTHRGSEPRVLKKGPLAPSDEDRTNYANLLAQHNTGLIRLLPRQYNQSKNADRAVKIRGGGAYYSFAFLTHEYGFGSDLELSTAMRYMSRSPRDDDSDSDPGPVTTRDLARLPVWHSFSVGFAGADYGMMTTLGDVALEDIRLDDSRLSFVLAYRPPRAEPVARAEAMAFRKGVMVGWQLYQSSLPIQVNCTYLLRSISYDRSDVAVAFRVVRQETDDSVTIAWKLLKKFPTPPLARN